MPKTAEQEKLQGNPGHRPVNKSAPVPDPTIPNPPRWLGKIGTHHYHQLVRLVGSEGMRVMGASDREALAMVCDAFEEYRRCNDIIEAEGAYFESGKVILLDDGSHIIANKQIKRHPAVGDRQNAWGRYMTGLGKFGLNPYERQKVSTLGEAKKEKTREEIMKERREAAQKQAQAAKNVVPIQQKVAND